MDIAIIFSLVVVGAFLQGATGFGFPFFVTPIAAIIMPELIPGTMMVVSIFISTDVVFRERHNIIYRETGLISLGRVVGAAGGAFIVSMLTLAGIKIMVAVVVMAGVLLSFTGARPRINVKSLLGVGVLSGFFGTSTTVGGPPVAMLYQHKSGPEVRAVMGSVLLIGSAISIFWLAVFGVFTLQDFTRALFYLPAVIIGLILARYGASYLDKGRTRAAILIASSAACLVLLIDAWL
jgi:uncharacterized membrane protein YfcA